MGEQVFKSPGVFSREFDKSFSGPVEPFGTPAGVVGTATKGPAFVPVTLASFKDFVDVFGDVDGERFGPYAIKEFLGSAQSAVYVRVLSVGDGKQRESTATDGSANAGRVNNAGFVVGGTYGGPGGNANSIEAAFNHQKDINTDGSGTAAGRTYFLGALHSQSAGSTYLSDAGFQTLGTAKAAAIIRGVLFAASGTILRLSASATGSGIASVGDLTGTVKYTDSSFVLVVSGHLDSVNYPRFVTASFDVSKKNYFGKVFNRSAFDVRNHGYMLYESFDIGNALVNITGTSVVGSSGSDASTDYQANIAFLLTGTLGRNIGSANVPNYENFEERYTIPTSPNIISQTFGGTAKNLFKIEALSDGAWANDKIKISIGNIKRSTDSLSDYGTFSLYVRSFSDNDDNPIVYEQFNNVSLDLNSPNYIARRVGDKRVRFDFDQLQQAQKVIVEGEYDNVSKFIRVVPSDDLKNGSVNASALPCGFQGIKALVTSGSARLAVPVSFTETTLSATLASAVQPPLPLRKHIATGVTTKKEVNKRLYWGVQFERPVLVTDVNKGNVNENIAAYTRFYGNENLSGIQPAITGSDVFGNNKFTLENIQIFTGSTNDIADQTRASEWAYIRNGGVTSNTAGTRAFDVARDLNTNSNLAKFTFILQGGFDGVNIFDKEFVNIVDGAAIKEAGSSGLQTKGPTVATYRAGVDVVTNPTNIDVNIIATPGMTEPLVADYALAKTEDRFDALYIMDIQRLDDNKNAVSSTLQIVSTRETISNHQARGLNSNFGAAYYPDVRIFDATNRKLVDVPPSVVVLGAFAFNDRVAQPWFAAAGFNRGALASVTDVRTQLSQLDRDNLQIVNINPIATFPGKGAVVFGQKSLQQAQSALDRVNVRRLLIEVRRAVKRVSNLIVFEPNRDATLARFTNLINPIMSQIQAQSGIERFKVKIDSTTTSPADIENNLIRGKIFLQPTRTIEYISLDFIVTNNAVSFG